MSVGSGVARMVESSSRSAILWLWRREQRAR